MNRTDDTGGRQRRRIHVLHLATVVFAGLIAAIFIATSAFAAHSKKNHQSGIFAQFQFGPPQGRSWRTWRHHKPHQAARLIDPEGTAISTCGTTISSAGYYVVTQNLTLPDPSGICITISASDVTLNLQGFNLTGPGTTGSSTGIFIDSGISNAYIVGNSNFNIAPGNITGFVTGIDDLGTNSFIEDFVTKSNVDGLTLEGTGGIVLDFDANDNSDTGVYVNKGSNYAASDFQADGNVSDGILFASADNDSATLMSVSSNKQYGVSISSSSGIFLTALDAENNANDGVFVSEAISLQGVVQGGIESNNGQYGIEFQGATKFKVSANTAQNNGTSDLIDDSGCSTGDVFFGNIYGTAAVCQYTP